MPNWLNVGGNKKPDDGVIEITPESLNKTLTEQKTELEGKLTELGSRIDNHPTLAAMQVYLDEQRASREAAARKQNEQQVANQNAQFNEIDPTMRQYVDQSLKPIADAALWQQGTELRRNIFDNAEAFPYYNGSLKEKVDALLDSQPAAQRANPDVIRNVYKIVFFDNQKEIDEGKHKSRLASASTSGSGTGMPNQAGEGGMPVLTQQMKSVAKAMGMSEADYATAMKELQDAGEYA